MNPRFENMKKVLIIYDTQFGNTKKLAEDIAAGIQEIEGISCDVVSQKDLDVESVATYDGFAFGGPVHAFRATRGITGAIRKVAKIGIDGKLVTTFDTHMGDEYRAIKGMEKLLRKIAPGSVLISPGFSGKVNGFRGPLDDTVPSEARAFGATLGQKLVQ